MSGIVEEVSDAVASQTGLQRGDSVMALVGGGGYAGQLQHIHTCTYIETIHVSPFRILCCALSDCDKDP